MQECGISLGDASGYRAARDPVPSGAASVPDRAQGVRKVPSQAEIESAQRTLGGTHKAVLSLLALLALNLFLGDFDEPSPPPDPQATTAAVGLALAAILLRRFASSPIIRPSSAVFLSVGALVSAAGLGVLGTLLALETGSAETGLLFTLAGFIFALRIPRPLGVPGAG